MKKIRTRYAPSPTGRMHVGNLRTALYAYLIAKHEGGDFLLRIEDTDRERFVEGALEIIENTLKYANLIPDEGPDKDGGYGPYVQSERHKRGIYMEYAKKLIDKGEAYYCFCDQDRLNSLKKTVAGEEIMTYDKHCLGLSKEEVEANLAKGIPFVIRQNNPSEGKTTFIDDIYGEISVDNSQLDDMVLIKSDGYPTYNFANVVDDHMMEITHVVRGNEYLSSAPKYNRLYEAFGWEVPVYVHCPTITNEEHKKLSKRCGHASFEDLLDLGFIPESILNFVALLGWSPDDDREIFSLEDLVKVFNYKNISKSPAVFDMVKLKWMNSEYLKAMDDEKFYELAKPYIDAVISKPLDKKRIASMVKTRIEVFPDIASHIDFFEAMADYDNDLYVNKKMKTDTETSLQVLKDISELLEKQEDYSNDALYSLISSYVKKEEKKTGYVMWPIRIALSGKLNTPAGATEIMEVLGKEESLKRIREGIDKLQS